MCKLIAVVIAVLALCSCGDKVTDITYNNGYYSCVGTWATDVLITGEFGHVTVGEVSTSATICDTINDTLVLNDDKTWEDKRITHHVERVSSAVRAFRDTMIYYIRSGYNYIQNNQSITLLKNADTLADPYHRAPWTTELNMIDSSTIYSFDYIFKKIK